MIPGRIANHNILYHEPENFDRKQLGIPWPLYARRTQIADKYIIQTAWFPTIQELQALARGAPVILDVAGEAQPPTKVWVGQPADKLNPLPRATHVHRSLIGSKAITVVFDTAPSDDELELLKEHLQGAAK